MQNLFFVLFPSVLVLARIELTFHVLRGSPAGGLGPDGSRDHSMSWDIKAQHTGRVFGFWISGAGFSGGLRSLLGTGSVPVALR